MTGKHFSGSLYDYCRILLRHNLRYMWWYRKYCKILLRCANINCSVYPENSVLKYVRKNAEKVFISVILTISPSAPTL